MIGDINKRGKFLEDITVLCSAGESDEFDDLPEDYKQDIAKAFTKYLETLDEPLELYYPVLGRVYKGIRSYRANNPRYGEGQSY